ncbi:hypothetical protein J4E83_000627 [Alternaria metachromatica]|uniref:uncharacterized protein n=1 Tax=Alternaria metachromatica TaxID=283354 RepID=UPI0020C28C08|nr:uncharacterized protein J4E83_000627 [Alternaria metachromatica]KAI4637809.1 hypothetical protein J4E83_000627 [Alternaria metachromatica]
MPKSKKLYIWKLSTTWPSERPSRERLVEKNFRLHVDEKEYEDEDGDYRCIVKLIMRDDTYQESHASGVLVGPDTILTSAHNVLDHRETSVSHAVAVKAYIGYHLGSSSGGKGVQERFGTMVVVPAKFVVSEYNASYDRALIKVDSIFTQVKPAMYRAPSSGMTKVLVVGYPGNNTSQVRNACSECLWAGCMYVVKGEAELKVQKLLHYKLSTAEGNSGGPVFLDEMPRTVIATHTGGASEGINRATAVDVDFIKAGRAALKQQHPSPHRYIVMRQQAGTYTWVLLQPEREWTNYVPGSRASRR